MLRTWIRGFVRDSILLGVNDAVAEIADGTPDAPDALARLRERLALPAPAAAPAEAEATSGRKRGKGE